MFVTHIQAAFIWTWNGLKAEDSVNKADKERDEKRIWHLQSQVLREQPGSEVHTQAGRRTLKFQSPRSLECPVSLLLTPSRLLSPPLPCLGPRIECPELARLHYPPLWPSRQTASVLSHFTLSALYIECRGCDCPLCRPQIQRQKVPQGWSTRPPTLHCTGRSLFVLSMCATGLAGGGSLCALRRSPSRCSWLGSTVLT